MIGGILINDKELMDMLNKVNSLKEKDENLYTEKVEELKNTIGKDKVEKKLAEIEKKYGNQLNEYVKKVETFKQGATNEQKAEMILEMKKKLSKDDQKKFDKMLNIFKNYMKEL